MSKVICDICGTAYPETATQCPICGSAKVSGDQTAAGDASVAAGEDTSYVYVPGGRFSKQNVRRRNKRAGVSQERRSAGSRQTDDGEEGANKGLIAVVIVLLLAIVAVVIYIGIRFLAPGAEYSPADTSQTSGTEDTTSGSAGQGIPCTALEISNKTIEFRASGADWLLVAVCTPENTTDTVTYTSADETVATVAADGRITAVGAGETVITVTCGETVQECRIICNFESETPTDAPTEEPTDPVDSNFVFEFNTKYVDESSGKYDTTISAVGNTWRAYKNNLSVSPSEITWISDNTDICTVENGIVTAVAPGKTEIHAQYGGQTYTCIVRVSGTAVTQPDNSTTTGTEAGGTAFSFLWADYDAASGKYDATIKVGNTWTAYPGGIDPADVTWTVDDTSICTVSNGVVTALSAGKTELHATYNGTTYTCIVRVTG